MNYLVTGGAGFIGSHITDALIKNDNQVIVVDDLSYGKRDNVNTNAEFHQLSISNRQEIEKLCNEYSIEGIFHLGAIASVQKSVENPELIHQVNLSGTLNILLAAKNSGVNKVVFSASAAAYGNNPSFPKKESMLPNPLSPYAVTKLSGEMYCKTFTDLYGLKTVALRYFNVYGPRQDPKSEYAAVIPAFITKYLAGEQLIIYGDGKQTRDFVYVQDVVQGNLLAMEKDTCGVFNIGTGCQTSLNQIIIILKELTNTHIKVKYLEPRVGDVHDSVADISLATKHLNYYPKYSIKEGLNKTLEFFASKKDS